MNAVQPLPQRILVQSFVFMATAASEAFVQKSSARKKTSATNDARKHSILFELT